MATTHPGIVLRQLRELVTAKDARTQPDRQLLARFAARREEAAFAALVRRHGPLVLGVCRRVLGQEQDAEDAFQATFLTLARKATFLGTVTSLGGWLHRVAYHTALRARKRSAARQRREARAARPERADPLDEVTGRELLAVLDEELQRLPEEERQAMVLCYLEGRTRDEAARDAGCSASTLKRRLEQGKGRMRQRLARRGLALPAALLALGLTLAATAGVPAALAARTVQAALGTAAAGPFSAAAGALAAAVARGLSASRIKLAATLLVLGTLVFGTGLPAGPTHAPRPAAPPAPAQPAPLPAKGGEDAKEPAVSGRVVDADGKPVKGAVVAGFAGLEFGNLSVQYEVKSLGETKTDAEGRFRLPAPSAPGERVRSVELLAGARGHGPAWGHNLPVGKRENELRLPPEEDFAGRLIDLQGQPAAGVKLCPASVLPSAGQPPERLDGKAGDRIRFLMEEFRQTQGFVFRKDSPLKDSSPWPRPVTTDAEGRFRLGGFGHGQEVCLVVEDDRFARQEVIVQAGARERSFGLLPPHKFTGRVVTADTDKPVASAWVSVISYHDTQGHLADARTDADGRYSVNAYPGETYGVEVYPQRGEPYLVAVRSADWPRGAVKQEVNVKLPRGAVVRAQVVEAGTGQALVSAAVAFVPQGANNPRLPRGVMTGSEHKYFTGPEGAVTLVVPPGPGHLVVTGPSAEYTYRAISEGEFLAGKPGGPVRYFHGLLPLDLRAGDEPKVVTVGLRRAITLKGRAVGPDGKPVKDAVVFVPGELLPQEPRWNVGVSGVPFGTRVAGVAVRPDGSFELPNCDPDTTYHVGVLSGRAQGERDMRLYGSLPFDGTSVVNRLIAGKDPLGAVVDLSAKRAGGETVQVKLARCQSAEVRFVDAAGKAVQQKVWLELLVGSGPRAKARTEGVLLASPYSLWGQKSPVEADAEGRITLPGLIPGATYRLKVFTGPQGFENEVAFTKEFTVEAGKTTRLELVAPGTK